ncbi:MAG: DUF4845 domain-containing protein [Proteobacteria bacterium]|nr:DUF4845 domain-containing protein [Pseudomonadota bacterium]
MIGFVIVMCVVGFFAYMAMRLIPMYSEYSSVRKALDETAADPAFSSADETKLRDMISRHFETSYVNSIDPMVKTEPGGVVIKRTSQGTTLSVDYDARGALFYNISLVAHFQHTAGGTPDAKPLPGGG